MNVVAQTLSGWLFHHDDLRERFHALARNVFVNTPLARTFEPRRRPHVGDAPGKGLHGSAPWILTGRVAGATRCVSFRGWLGSGAAVRIAFAPTGASHRFRCVPSGPRPTRGRTTLLRPPVRNDGSPYGVERRSRPEIAPPSDARRRRPRRRRVGPAPRSSRLLHSRRDATTRRISPICSRGSMAVERRGNGAALDLWQRQAVLAAASLLRHRFNDSPDDTRARTLHDALLEVVEPRPAATCGCSARCRRRRPARIAVRSERRSRGRRSGTDRRFLGVRVRRAASNGGVVERRGAPGPPVDAVVALTPAPQSHASATASPAIQSRFSVGRQRSASAVSATVLPPKKRHPRGAAPRPAGQRITSLNTGRAATPRASVPPGTSSCVSGRPTRRESARCRTSSSWRAP